MVGLGMFFIGMTLLALFFCWRGTLFDKKWLMWVFVFAVVGPYIANQLGWVAAEVGRQPWIVYGLLRTSDAASPAVAAGEVLGSIIMFGLIYLLLFGIWLYRAGRQDQGGPEPAAPRRRRTSTASSTAAMVRRPRRAASMTDNGCDVGDADDRSDAMELQP